MIETDKQRRWWFAHHPEFSESRTGASGRAKQKETHKAKGYTPEDVHAYVQRALNYLDGTEAAMLMALDKAVQTAERVSETPARSTGHPAADPASYDKYEDALDRIQRAQREESIAKGKEEAVVSDIDEFLDFFPLARWATAPVQGFRGLLGRLARDAILSAKQRGPRQPPRLPPRGTPERAKIERDRKKGIDAKKEEELSDIKAGGKGSGTWSEEQLAEIRGTGKFPEGVHWHHDPTVANRPNRAADPNSVRPMPGGRKQHLEDGHQGNWRYPEE
jgi:hypothetical protein